MREGRNDFLDRLGEPFLFAEEGVMNFHAGELRRFKNTLPKVIFFLDGKFHHGFDNEPRIPCGPGNVMINLRESFQNYSPARPGHPGYSHALRITFNPELLQKAILAKGAEDEFLPHFLGRIPPQAMLPPPSSQVLPELIHEIRREVTLKLPGSRPRVNALLRLSLLDLIRAPESRLDHEVPLLERIESYLESELHRSLTLAEVARQVDRSEEHIARFYREQRGTTIFRELRRRRIEKAKYYLLCSSLSVTDIAQRTGFSNVALFSRVFRQETRKCPTAFRIKNPGL